MDIKLFRELVDAIGGAGDAVSEIADDLKHLVATGAEAYDVANARLIYAKLVEMSVEASSLKFAQSAAMGSFRDYLRYLKYFDEPAASELDRRWETVTGEVAQRLTQLNYLLERIEEVRSNFDGEPAYDKLYDLLSKQHKLAASLVSSGRPVIPEELGLVHEAADRYDILIEQLGRARDEMNVYIRTLGE